MSVAMLDVVVVVVIAVAWGIRVLIFFVRVCCKVADPFDNGLALPHASSRI